MESKSHHSITVQQLKSDFDTHLEDYNNFRAEYNAEVSAILDIQKRSAKGIEALQQSTQDMVTAWTAVSLLGKLLKWAAGLIITLGVIWVWLKDIIHLT